MSKKICIVGAGIVGLCTAWQARNQFGGDCQIHVIADKFEESTVSACAIGIFEPHSKSRICDNFEELWKLSFDFFIDLLKSKAAGKAGISMVDGFRCHQIALSDETIGKMKTLVYNFEEVDAQTMGPVKDRSNIAKVYHYSTLMMDSAKFLIWASEVLINQGVQFLTRHIDDFQELADEDYEIIFNCSGLGSCSLAKDKDLESVRGQIVKINAPWIKQFYNFFDESTSIHPGEGCCVVGSTFQKENFEAEPCKSITEAMLKRVANRIPSLENAQVQVELAGFRPERASLRLEKGDTLTNKSTGNVANIFHNYG